MGVKFLFFRNPSRQALSNIGEAVIELNPLIIESGLSHLIICWPLSFQVWFFQCSILPSFKKPDVKRERTTYNAKSKDWIGQNWVWRFLFHRFKELLLWTKVLGLGSGFLSDFRFLYFWESYQKKFVFKNWATLKIFWFSGIRFAVRLLFIFEKF